MTGETRRAYLAGLGAVGATALGGCSALDLGSTSGSDPGGNSNGGDGTNPDGGSGGWTTEVPPLRAGDPAYRNWVPGTGDRRAAFDAAHHIGQVRENRSALPAATYESRSLWAMFGGYVGVEYGELDGMLVGLGSPVVYLGSFARTDVESRLEATRYGSVREEDGVAFYRRGDGEDATYLGVADAGVVYGTGDGVDPFVEETLAFVRTARGERPRLHEESATYAEYTDAMAWPLVVAAGPPGPVRGGGPAANRAPGLPASNGLPESVRSGIRYGHGRYLAEGSLVHRARIRPLEDGGVSAADVRDAYRSDGVASELADDERIAVRIDGSVVDVARLDPVEDPGGGADPVLANLDVTVEGTTATVEHVAGDPVPLDRVTVRAGSESLDPGGGTLEPGGSLSLDVGDAGTVIVVYETPTAEGKTVLGRT